MRIACIEVADFPLAALLRNEPELREAALAVTDGPGPRSCVVALSAAAARRGVRVGSSAAQAHAIAGDLALRPASAAAEHAAQAALCDAAYAFSPRMEEGAPGTVYADAGGLQGLFASEDALARAMVRAARGVGLEAAVGIAGTKIAARLAARSGGGAAVVPAREEWRFLAPLAIELLAPSPALRRTLQRWGLRTLGDLAALPASAVAVRLGPEGAALARRARGEDAQPLSPRPLPLCFEESAGLDWGVDTLEPFLFVVRGLLERLTARLALRGLICGDLRLSLGLATHGRDERTVTVAAPSNEIKPLLTLIRLQLEAAPPGAPVERVLLAAVPERLRPMQLDLFRPNGPAPAQLAATVARLAALCGAERVGAPRTVDSHRPDAYGVAPFAPPPAAVERPLPHEIPRAVRALRPPLRLTVFSHRGVPDVVRPADPPAPAPYRCDGRIVTLAGPWRLHGDWWRSDTLHRDYYDAQLSDGVVYRLYFDRTCQQWFADGAYD